MSNSSKQGSLMLALLPLVILYVCTVILFALTREDLGGTVGYWEYFVPVVAFISLIGGWGTAYARGQWRLFYLIKQAIIWGAFIGMLWMLQGLGYDSALGDQKTTVLVASLLALVSVLVGMQLDWKMFFYGAFLGLCAYLLADPSHSGVLMQLGDRFGVEDAQSKPLTMVSGLAVLAFVVSFFILLSVRGSIMAKRNRS